MVYDSQSLLLGVQCISLGFTRVVISHSVSFHQLISQVRFEIARTGTGTP